MLVYGDVERFEKPAATRASIARLMMACSELEPGRERHETLVRAFIATGELVQGLADREFDKTGADDVSMIQDAGAKLLLGQAQAILQSWRNGFDGLLPLPENWRTTLRHLDSGEPVRMKRGEGYAFYALYPETYIEAASKSKLTPEAIVIGIRSIGLGLAALVCATIGARPAYSLRPVGNPYERCVRLTSKLSRCILANPRADFAVVDEGPGLSGSSFGSVADWLEANGVAPNRIHFFPSHACDPGPHASAPHRMRWKQRPRHVVGFDDAILNSPSHEHRLQTWVTDLVGSANWSRRDLSGGAWRSVRYSDPSLWPPSYSQMEKRKFLMQAEGGAWHVKFAGLHESAHKAQRGSLLAEAGFSPKIAGACYGFIVERWADGASLDSVNVRKRKMVDHLGRYLSFRARHLPAPGGGASIQMLCDMAVFNVEKAVGAKSAEKLRPLIGSPDRLCRNLHRVDTDNRLHPWEWLITGDQNLLKTDALDHSSAHDLVGCQDVAWDVAGACVEFDLSSGERQRLAELIAQEVDCDLRDHVLDVFEACYLGFQIGLWSQASAIADGAERPRIEGTIKRYLTRLRQFSDRLD
ncbi:hypothetical protein [Phyllobacterium endophyticum]|uniref:Uncharacterized protein n=1 Tax=Phyllobacterium endophyticum TaxID=1149773 RepID=A0A2P7ANS9_9HYPH|nr:hypothetical protein [Phyllobacterium endophyticum]MBB3233790.1 hypothetical protein [Phyllobacterium endophyticum]PSH55873.1 hypothetical protein CU100_19700 [Phyllobacterium endophyticum]TYR41013.1 hypothetical protein FY050_06715 [Phyllobacterium endophyticum]